MVDGTLLAAGIILGLAIITIVVVRAVMHRSERRAARAAGSRVPPTEPTATAPGVARNRSALNADPSADPRGLEEPPSDPEEPIADVGGADVPHSSDSMSWLDRDIAALAQASTRSRMPVHDTRLVLFNRDPHDRPTCSPAPAQHRVAVEWDGRTAWMKALTLDSSGFLGQMAVRTQEPPSIGTPVRATTYLQGSSLVMAGEVTTSAPGHRGAVLFVAFNDVNGEQEALLSALAEG